MRHDPIHVAAIMDGNGRWARRRGLPRTAGHRRGADTARRVVEAAPGLGIGRLTLFAFSSDNWQRPPGEVSALMHLLREHLRREAEPYRRHGVRLGFLGRRDRLDPELRAAMTAAERTTRDGDKLELRVALDYSARESIAVAARHAAADGGSLTAAELERHLGGSGPAPVDLLIRTGGEQRLSDFLLWECAYAELYFTDTMWPDFGPRELRTAVEGFRRRDRRFGRVGEEPRSSALAIATRTTRPPGGRTPRRRRSGAAASGR